MENEEKLVVTMFNLEKFEGKYAQKISGQDEHFSFSVLESSQSALKKCIGYVKECFS